MIDIFNLIIYFVRMEALFTLMWLQLPNTGPSEVFQVDLMDEIPLLLFHTLWQFDQPKVIHAERE